MVFLSIGWSLSLMLAPFLGGLLADPLFLYPSLNDSLPEFLVDLLQRYPFLLPNLTVVIFNVVTIIYFFIKLEETRAAHRDAELLFRLEFRSTLLFTVRGKQQF